MKFFVDFQLLLAVLILVIGYVHAVEYEYAAPVKKLPIIKHEEECHCGYVLEERVELHCKPQKRIVKVLKKKGNCIVNDKPILVDAVEEAHSNPSSYRYGIPAESGSNAEYK